MISVWFSLIKNLLSQEHTKFKPILEGIFGIRFVSNPHFVELRLDSTIWVISGKQFR